MGKTFMMLLMLIIVFLTGMLFGVEKNQTISTQAVEQNTSEKEQAPPETQHENSKEKKTEKANQKNDNKQAEQETEDLSDEQYFTHKTASFLEKGVKSFYNIVVEVMYGFSKVFF